MNRKKIKHQTISIFIIASFLFSFFYSCSKNETTSPDGNPITGANGKSAGGQFTAAAANEHSISVEDARAFIQSYYQETTSRMTEEEKKMVATSVYFPLDALENYIKAMKQYNTRSSGLRVYFARYNKPHVNTLALNDTTLLLDHNGVNTVIMVATESDKDGFPIDIIGEGAYLPFNVGISCPPMPPNYCKGLYCPLIED
jgi:hypothetical protein